MKQYDLNTLTPQGIVNELDKYIIGQKSAKRNVAIALRNRWRRMQVKTMIKADITPNNILMIGATGVGKSEIARRLAKIVKAPFVKVEASKFTEVGYVGRDVESMVRDLVEQSVTMVKTIQEEELKDKAMKRVENIIIDALISDKNSPTDLVQVTDASDTLTESLREAYRKKIREGEMEDYKVKITVDSSAPIEVGMIGGGMMDEAAFGKLQEMFNNMMPKKSTKKKVAISEAKKLLLTDELTKLLDMDAIKEEALERAAYLGMIFIDEIDKIAGNTHKGSGPDVSREGVQRDLLPIVEGSNVSTKYGAISTDHILFIAAGAFHVAKPSDLIPELQGRFPIRVELDNLTKEDFHRILKEPQNALTKQYSALFEAEQVKLVFEEDAIEELANTAFSLNEQIENIGARRLHTVMSHLLNEFLFDMPDRIKANETVTITKRLVQERLEEIVKNKALNEYIL